MFGETSVKQRLLEGKTQVGLFANLPGSVSAYLVAGCGYDVVLLDHEHGPADFTNVVDCVNAASASKAEVWVRVPGNDQAYIKRVLDSGADGIMCPMVNSAAEARALVRHCQYPPLGIRGLAPALGRHTGYGLHREAYMARIAQDLAIMPQIESAEAVECIDEIVAVEGVDIIFLGPFDLSASYGHPGKTDHPVVAAAIDRIEASVRRAGKRLASLAVPGRDAAVLLERGYDLVFGGADTNLLRTAMQETYTRLDKARREK